MQAGSWRNEVVPHHKRIIVFEDLDCNGNADWLMKREYKQKRTEPLLDEEGTLYGSRLAPGSARSVAGISAATSAIIPIKESDKWLLHSGPTLGGLLNTLDGVCELQGHIVILTTNHADALDSALLRAGRVDLRITMGYMQPADMVEMVSYTFDAQLSSEEVALLTAACGKMQWTASDLQEVMQGAESVKQAMQLIVHTQPPSQKLMHNTTTDQQTGEGGEYR